MKNMWCKMHLSLSVYYIDWNFSLWRSAVTLSAFIFVILWWGKHLVHFFRQLFTCFGIVLYFCFVFRCFFAVFAFFLAERGYGSCDFCHFWLFFIIKIFSGLLVIFHPRNFIDYSSYKEWIEFRKVNRNIFKFVMCIKEEKSQKSVAIVL